MFDFNDTSIFWTDFRKNPQIPNFMKIRPVGAELFHADGWTDRHDEANKRFSPNLLMRLKKRINTFDEVSYACSRNSSKQMFLYFIATRSTSW